MEPMQYNTSPVPTTTTTTTAPVSPVMNDAAMPGLPAAPAPLAILGTALDGHELFAVVDPLSRKLLIPRSAVYVTRAMERHGTPSLCMLHQSGRCRQAANCHQVHADPPTVQRLRDEATQQPTCCVEHGDGNSTLMKDEWLERSVDVNGVVISASRLAYTVGAAKLFTDSFAQVVRTPTQQVCRLHVSDRCRYSEDCKFLHVCRKEVETKLAAWVQPMAPRGCQPRNQAPVPAAQPAPVQQQMMMMPQAPPGMQYVMVPQPQQQMMQPMPMLAHGQPATPLMPGGMQPAGGMMQPGMVPMAIDPATGAPQPMMMMPQQMMMMPPGMVMMPPQDVPRFAPAGDAPPTTSPLPTAGASTSGSAINAFAAFESALTAPAAATPATFDPAAGAVASASEQASPEASMAVSGQQPMMVSSAE